MTDQPTPSGVVNVTPEGGPVNEGTPAAEPGAGQVRLTPEAGPLGEQAASELRPPTWQEHMKGPIIGLDDRAAAPSKPAEPAAAQTPPPPAAQVPPPPYSPPAGSGRTAEDDEELKKWPPYTGKPVSDVQDAWRYAAPVVAQAEKLAISALGLAGTGLTKLAGFLEQRRQDRSSSGDSR
ncbi:MAG: hypothetical protein U0075_03695 [Thermomicrobiales bacterium]